VSGIASPREAEDVPYDPPPIWIRGRAIWENSLRRWTRNTSVDDFLLHLAENDRVCVVAWLEKQAVPPGILMSERLALERGLQAKRPGMRASIPPRAGRLGTVPVLCGSGRSWEVLVSVRDDDRDACFARAEGYVREFNDHVPS
jgi:hypothetical protein